MNIEKRKACIPVYEAEWNEKFRLTKTQTKRGNHDGKNEKCLYYGSPADQTQNFNAP